MCTLNEGWVVGKRYEGRQFEGFARGVRGDVFTCKWHPFKFFVNALLNKNKMKVNIQKIR